MQRFERSLVAVLALVMALSLNAAPRETKTREPRPDVQQKQTSPNPWTRLIRKILDDVIPPPDNRGSIPPG